MADRPGGCDVRVTGASKSYGRTAALDGLHMRVPSRTIYGLLGPSGCGKSTLLQCILGTITLDSGSIEFSAKSLKDVGYMPQDLCLEETMTVKETFGYYGALYNMSKKNIDNRIAELNTYLHLPDLNSYIEEISGGQSRRVSLAISLLHNPKVIILDEPTVGIDPLVRKNIWEAFTKMVEHGKTIIITTHYIEEANQADCIGLMRKGMLVEEASPRDILVKYGTDSLESSFLKLCCSQEMKQIVNKRMLTKTGLKKITEPENNIKWYRIKALLKKNFHLSSRDYLLLFTMFVLPILQTFNFCYGVGVNFKYMSIAIKNDEIGVIDCQYINLDGCIFDGDSNQTMSCVVVNYLASRDYKLVEVKDHEAGEMSINKSNYLAFIHFPKNYTKDLMKFIDSREYYENESRTYVHLTKENFLFRNQITKDVVDSITYLMKKTLSNCSNNSKIIDMPLEFITLFGHDVESYTNGIISLFIAMCVFYFPSVFAVSTMMSEKMDGTLSRSMIAGVKVMEVLISMFFSSTVINLVQTAMMCFIAFVLFSNPVQITSGLFLYMLVMLFLGWTGFLFGILTAVLSPTKLSGIYVITGSSMTQFLLSEIGQVLSNTNKNVDHENWDEVGCWTKEKPDLGAIWPLEGQPILLRKISKLLPIWLAGNTMNNIALKGWTLDHSLIVTGITMTFTYTMLLVFSLIVLGQFKKNLWVVQK